MATESFVQSELLNKPIPELVSSAGWKDVPIRENGEKLVPLNELDSKYILADPQYFKQKIPHALPTMYVREAVAQKLLEAVKMLPEGYRLLIWDAWRPLEVQQSLFDDFKSKLHSKNPDWSEERLNTETQTYVSLPSTNPSCPSPHNTGGAIDLTICTEKGIPLSMGVPFDFFGPEAGTNYYEKLTNLTPAQTEARNNRRLLFHIMEQAGISNYDEEYWHFDYGNQFDAKRTGKKYAIYRKISLGGE